VATDLDRTFADCSTTILYVRSVGKESAAMTRSLPYRNVVITIHANPAASQHNERWTYFA
jgi:hypothetical protein